MAIRDYIETVAEEDRYCNGCELMQKKTPSGACGQVIIPFGTGVCRCDEHELMWAYSGRGKVDRPLECLLTGKKYLRRGGRSKIKALKGGRGIDDRA